MEAEIDKLKDKIIGLSEKYKKLTENQKQEEINNAFIVFRSIEGVARA